VIKLNFEDISLISEDVKEPDYINLKFVRSEFFSDAYDYHPLKNGTTISYSLPRILTDGDALELAEFTKAVDSAAATAGAGNIVIMILLSQVINKVWNLINLLQFFVFFPTWLLNFPDKALAVMKSIKYVAFQEFIPQGWLVDLIKGD